MVWKAFKLGIEQSLMCALNQGVQRFRVVVRPVLHRYRKVPTNDQAAVTVLLKEEKASSALYVGEGFWRRLFQKLKPLPAHDRKMEIPKKFLVVNLTNAQEVKYVLVKIVQDFDS